MNGFGSLLAYPQAREFSAHDEEERAHERFERAEEVLSYMCVRSFVYARLRCPTQTKAESLAALQQTNSAVHRGRVSVPA